MRDAVEGREQGGVDGGEVMYVCMDGWVCKGRERKKYEKEWGVMRNMRVDLRCFCCYFRFLFAMLTPRCRFCIHLYFCVFATLPGYSMLYFIKLFYRTTTPIKSTQTPNHLAS